MLERLPAPIVFIAGKDYVEREGISVVRAPLDCGAAVECAAYSAVGDAVVYIAVWPSRNPKLYSVAEAYPIRETDQNASAD